MLLSVWEGWHWDDNKGGWLDPELSAKERKCTQRSSGKLANVRLEGHPSRQDGRAGTDRRQSGNPTVRAKWVAKKYKTHARPQLYASTAALVDVRTERVSTLQHEGEYSLNYRPRTISQAMNTCAGCCNTACMARATPHKNWEEELTSTLSDLKLTRRGRTPVRVARAHQG